MKKRMGITRVVGRVLAFLAFACGAAACSDSTTGSSSGFRLTWLNNHPTAVRISIEGAEVRWLDQAEDRLAPGDTRTTWEYYPAGARWDVTVRSDVTSIPPWEFTIRIDAGHTSFKTVPQ